MRNLCELGQSREGMIFEKCLTGGLLQRVENVDLSNCLGDFPEHAFTAMS